MSLLKKGMTLNKEGKEGYSQLKSSGSKGQKIQLNTEGVVNQ